MIPALIDLAASPVPSGLATALLAFLKMTCVLVMALAVTLAMRQASAGARHLVWLVALTSLLLLPALAAWGPVPVRVLPGPAVQSTIAPHTVAAPATLSQVQPSGALPVAPPASGGAVAQRVEDASAQRGAIGAGWLLIGFWLVGVVALLARLAFGAWGIHRIVRGARALETADWIEPLYEVADRLELREAPRLLQSERVAIPFATGFWNTTIVLPADSEGWSRERRSAVLIHELAHVRRRDLVGHAVSWVACALYWFHPLVWTAARRMRIESERACDDLALVLGTRPSEYAEHLLDIVTQVRADATPAVALAMANPNEFEGRLLAILNPRLRRRGPGRVQAAWLAGSLMLVALVVGAVTPVPRAAAKPPGAMPSRSATPALVARDDVDARSRSIEARAARAEAQESAVAAAEREEPPVADEHPVEVSRRETPSQEEAGAERVEVLVRTLRDDPSPEVRRVAAWGLENHADDKVAAEELAAALVWDEDEDVREMAAWALSESRGGSQVVNALYAAFRRDKSVQVRRTAAWAAGSIGDATAVPGLVSLLSHSDANVREVAAWSIGNCDPERAPAALVRALTDAEPGVRLSVAWALREIGDPAAADALEAAFAREKEPEVQRGLISALGSMGDHAIETLSRLVDSPDPEIRRVAVTALAGGNATGPWPWPRPEPRPFP